MKNQYHQPDPSRPNVVDQHITEASGPPRHEQLVKFIGAGIEKGDGECCVQQAFSMQSPGSQTEDQGEEEYGVFGDVGAFSHRHAEKFADGRHIDLFKFQKMELICDG